MEITQIQLSYVEREDRVSLRINMDADKHVGFVLTRRICRFMIENLNAFLGIVPPIGEDTSGFGHAVAAAAVSQLQQLPPAPAPSYASSLIDHRAVPHPGLSGMDTQTPFQERDPQGSILDAGKKAALVLNAACNRSDENLTFTFFMENMEPLNLNLTKQLGLGIHQMLAGLVAQAQWFNGLPQAVMASDTELESDSINQSFAHPSKKILYH